jgi:uncharacterized protein YdeI (YjbR/CyaY-like superfamily)
LLSLRCPTQETSPTEGSNHIQYRRDVILKGRFMADDAESLKLLRNLGRDGWRSWLETNHLREKEAWLVFYKKHTGKGKMTHSEALDEALCFGWIDGRLKRIDDEKHMIRFSPRRKGSIWSDWNVRRVRTLMTEGRMMPAGLAKIDSKTLQRLTPENGRPRPGFRVSPEMRKRLMTNEKAWKNYCALAPSSKEQYAYWLTSAKRPETREKRLREAIALLNKKLGMR